LIRLNPYAPDQNSGDHESDDGRLLEAVKQVDEWRRASKTTINPAEAEFPASAYP